ncbi:MAG: MATE family efflux transporter [Lachnospiraceae bacterium]|nr:MATE family efflux transporter [Lachnospiraceae bacterium]
MLETPIPRLVTQLAVPTVIVQLITLIYNTADTYFISQINKSASAAVGASFAVMALIQAVGFGLGMGACSLCSMKLGEGKDEEAHICGSSALAAAFLTGLVLMGLGLGFLHPLLRLIGCSETMLDYAAGYLRFILLVAPISCPSFVLSNLLRSEGDSKLAMYGMAGGGLLNMALDPLLIFGLGMGTAGAAIATAVSQIFSFSVMLSHFLRGKTIIRLKRRYVSREMEEYRLIVSTGLPTVFRQGISSVATVALSRQAVLYGDAAVAAITIANKCYILVRCIMLGIGQGYMPAAGYNYGAGLKKRSWEAFTFACKVGTVICCVSALLIAAFAGPLMWWFCKDEQVLELGRQTLYFVCAVMPVLGFSTFVNQLYQCLGFRLEATILASCRQGIFFLPIVMILPGVLGVTGVELSQPLADLMTCLVSIPFIIKMRRKYLNWENS